MMFVLMLVFALVFLFLSLVFSKLMFVLSLDVLLVFTGTQPPHLRHHCFDLFPFFVPTKNLLQIWVPCCPFGNFSQPVVMICPTAERFHAFIVIDAILLRRPLNPGLETIALLFNTQHTFPTIKWFLLVR